MATTLSDCVEAFDTSLDEIKILMEHEKDFFRKWTAKIDGSDDLDLHPKAVDKLEELCTEKDKLVIKFKTIADAMGIPVERIANVIAADKTKVFKNTVFRSPENTMETNNFRCKALTPLVEALLKESKMQPTGIKTKKSRRKKNEDMPIRQRNKLTPKSEPEETTLSNPEPTVDETVNETSDTTPEVVETPTVYESETNIVNGEELTPENNIDDTKPIKRKTPNRKKKSKYLASKKDFFDMFASSDINDIKTLRMFLLSLPDFRIEDIAIMSDVEIKSLFDKMYIAVTINGKTLVTLKSNLDAIWSRADINQDLFIIPNEQKES